MKQRGKRIVSMLLAVALLASSFTTVRPGVITANAADETAGQAKESDFEVDSGDGGIIIKKYTGTAPEVNLCEIFKGKKIVGIDSGVNYLGVNKDNTITKLVIPNTCATIGDYAFDGCTSLESVTFADGFNADGSIQESADAVTIGSDAFHGCTALRKIELPDKTTVIKLEAFYRARNLTEFTMPKNLTTIGDMAFEDCDALTAVTFGEKVETIGVGAFRNCDKLSKVSFNDTLNTIGKAAFTDCIYEKITIPKGCTSIGESAFNTGTLKRVDLGSNNATIGSKAFDGSNVILYGTDACTNATEYAKKYEKCKFQIYSDKLEITSKPDKTEYTLGENLDTTGLTLQAAYTKTGDKKSSETYGIPDLSNCVITGYNKDQLGPQTITVAYGEQKATFEVKVRLDLAKAGKDGDVTLVYSDDNPSAIYTGKAITPTVKVTSNDIELSAEKYNAPVYKNNVNAYTGSTSSSSASATAPSVMVSGDGIYTTGSITKYFNIKKRTMDDVTVTVAETSKYSGVKQEPAVTVTYNDEKVPASAYKVEYTSNINAAKKEDTCAYVTVSATTDSNFSGSKRVYFGIEQLDLKDAGITVNTGKAQVYTGKAVKPAKVEVTRPDPAVEGDTITLQERNDYVVSGYKNNVNVGIATVTLTGQENYTGTYDASYEIVARPLTDASITVKDIDDVTYDGKNHKPEVAVTYNRADDDAQELKEGTDYKVTIKDSKDAEVNNAGTYKVVVEGMGNYSGTVEKTFVVNAYNISDAKVTVEETEFVYDGTEACPKVTVSADGFALEKDQDYTVSYADNEKVGMAKVTITGKGNCKGSCEASYKITARPLTDASITVKDIDDVTYDGKNHKPEVAVTYNRADDDAQELKEGTDYKVTLVASADAVLTEETEEKTDGANENEAETENVTAVGKVGTYKVVVEGTGNYTGTVEKEFVIAYDLSDAKVTVEKEITYAGTKVCPDVTVSVNDKVLVKDQDYTVAYEDNEAVGTAKVIITGKGDYKGTVTEAFTIVAPKTESTTEAPAATTEAPAAATTEAPAAATTEAPAAATTEAPEADEDLDGDDDAVVIPTVKKVKQVKVTAKKKALVLKWKKMSGVAKYQIQFSTKKNFKKAKTYNVKKSQTSVNIKKLKKATKYYVRIRACKTYTDEDDNDKTVYGAWVTVSKKTK